nr:hypothetical protein [Tanacetum cinerariifolium]
MEIKDEMDGLEIIYPYEIKEGKLPPPPADSDTSSDSEPEVEAKDKDGDEATVGTITRASYSVPPFSGTIYVGSGSSRKVFAPGPIGNNVDMLQCKVKGLAQQMFDRANTEYSTLKMLGIVIPAARAFYFCCQVFISAGVLFLLLEYYVSAVSSSLLLLASITTVKQIVIVS